MNPNDEAAMIYWDSQAYPNLGLVRQPTLLQQDQFPAPFPAMGASRYNQRFSPLRDKCAVNQF